MPSTSFLTGTKKPQHVRLIVQVGALREIRTPDPLVRSQVLYPAELWAHYLFANLGDTLLFSLLIGALREIRTPDPLVRSQVLYPAELWARHK